MINTEAQIIVNHFTPISGPRPNLGAKLEYGDGAWRCVFYKEPDESLRHEVRYTDLVEENNTLQRDEAHQRSVSIIMALVPLYTGASTNLVFIEEEAAITLTSR